METWQLNMHGNMAMSYPGGYHKNVDMFFCTIDCFDKLMNLPSFGVRNYENPLEVLTTFDRCCQQLLLIIYAYVTTAISVAYTTFDI